MYRHEAVIRQTYNHTIKPKHFPLFKLYKAYDHTQHCQLPDFPSNKYPVEEETLKTSDGSRHVHAS